MLKYLLEQPATWKKEQRLMLLSEFYITYVAQKAITSQVIADYLVDRPIDETSLFRCRFLKEEILFIEGDTGRKMGIW